MHAFTISAEDDKIGGKKEKRPEKSLESSPTSVEAEAKPEAKGQDSGTSLKRAYSLSDLNKPNVPRRILPAPPANGNIKQNTMMSTNQRHIPLKCMRPTNFAPHWYTALFSDLWCLLFKLKLNRF